MIHRALLKVFGCSGAGALSGGIMIYLFVWSEWVEWGVESAQPFRLDWHEKEMVFLFAVVGALVGMIGGIGWAIEHNEARWRFLGWTGAGCVIAGVVWEAGIFFGTWESTDGIHWLFTIPLTGMGVGIVTALESAGVFARLKDRK
ncbi:MAG: hypothetical protein OXT74_18625 [Candidatus Poribacteria bacterium]|nr:hypothetical protein [Candidatus Poribacteria bacterium]